MGAAHMVLQTADGDFSPSSFKFATASTAQLDSLLLEARATARLIEAELVSRSTALPRAWSQTVCECERQLRKSLRTFDLLLRFDNAEVKSIELAAEILHNEPKVRAKAVFRDFLRDVIRHCGAGIAVLCAASIGKTKVAQMNWEDRLDLLECITKMKEELRDSRLDELAVAYGLQRDESKANILNVSSETDALVASTAQPPSSDSPSERTPMLAAPSEDNRGPQKKRKRIDAQPQAPESQPAESDANEQALPAAEDSSAQQNRSGDQDYAGGELGMPSIAESPSSETREMKYVCSNAPASCVSSLPDQFRTAIESSRLWKWERKQPGLETTGCISTVIPKGLGQDITLNIWCGYDDGYRIRDVLGLQVALSG